jgi:serine/threonine-protein kinase RsbW
VSRYLDKLHGGCVKLDTIPYEADLWLDGNVHELGRLAAEVERFCAANDVSSGTAFQLNLALEELFVNAIHHGGCEGMEGAVHVRMRQESGSVAIEFRDHGAPFDLASAPVADVGAPLSERRAGGLGIHLIRQIVGELAYRREDGWNVLTMQHGERQEAG